MKKKQTYVTKEPENKAAEIHINCLTLITTKQAAEVLGIEENTLAIWRSAKRYDLRYIKVGRLVKYRISDLYDFLQAHTV